MRNTEKVRRSATPNLLVQFLLAELTLQLAVDPSKSRRSIPARADSKSRRSIPTKAEVDLNTLWSSVLLRSFWIFPGLGSSFPFLCSLSMESLSWARASSSWILALVSVLAPRSVPHRHFFSADCDLVAAVIQFVSISRAKAVVFPHAVPLVHV
jgi:hypothetical protein